MGKSSITEPGKTMKSELMANTADAIVSIIKAAERVLGNLFSRSTLALCLCEGEDEGSSCFSFANELALFFFLFIVNELLDSIGYPAIAIANIAPRKILPANHV